MNAIETTLTQVTESLVQIGFVVVVLAIALGALMITGIAGEKIKESGKEKVTWAIIGGVIMMIVGVVI